ncbi:MAG: glycosyltransferase [Candidatus Nanohalobium sp.]
MRIGFFSDSYFPEIDGVTYTLKLWRDRLEERGHEVYIIYPESEGYEPDENEIPVRSVSNPFYPGYNIPLPTSLDFPELDVVHCHSPGPIGRAGRRYAFRDDAKAIYTHHTPLEEYFEQSIKSSVLADFLGRIYVPLEELFLSKFDKVMTNTDGDDRDVETVEVPAGIDMRFFQPREEEIQLEYTRPLIGYSGRLSDEKNVDEVLGLAEEIDADFIVVGEGPQKQKLVEEAPENVKFRDFLDREDLPKFYSMLDVFVTASTGDTLGISPLEANACGTPVVAADVHPFDTTIEGENGLRYDKGDIQDFAEKTGKAIEKEWNCRKAVRQYSLEKTMDKLLRIYAEAGKHD